ncbi:MAG: hypothetical protein JSV43_00505 [Methanobacteriota archaeon]|nr:MAG: hypothetical protein JSV43_00505 [Euryarchaeota archaeon]
MATTIAVSEGTRDKLKSYGRKGDTYDQIISRLMEIVNRETFLEEVYKRLAEKDQFVPLDELK